MVEVGGVEPPSESALQDVSPGADGYLHSLTQTPIVRLPRSVASSCMVRAKLTARTVPTKSDTLAGPWALRLGWAALSGYQLVVIVVS